MTKHADASKYNEVLQVLRNTGAELTQDLWTHSDETFLAARASDMLTLEAKAESATDPKMRVAYRAAAADVVNEVKDLALARLEGRAVAVRESLVNAFVPEVVRQLASLLPMLYAR